MNIGKYKEGGIADAFLAVILCAVIFLLSLVAILSVGESLEKTCRKDCAGMEGCEYVRVVRGSYSEDKCIIKLNGQIKNIW